MTEEVRKIEKTVYVAQDGKVFDKKKDCVKYDSELTFRTLKEKNGQCIRGIYDDNIKELVEIYLDMKKNLTSCTELYITQVNNDLDAQQLSAFCGMKEGNDLDHWSVEFKNEEKYLICVYTTWTKMHDDSIVFTIPYSKFKEFWCNMYSKVVALEDCDLPVKFESIKSPFKYFNEILHDSI